MMPLALFGSRSFVGLTLLTLLLYGALAALFLLVPYMLIEASGYTETAAGAALLPFPLVLAIASPMVGRMATRIGVRVPLTVAPLLVAAGFLTAAHVGIGGGYWTNLLPPSF
jgi:predicted MFS family arabinose efflux permease